MDQVDRNSKRPKNRWTGAIAAIGCAGAIALGVPATAGADPVPPPPPAPGGPVAPAPAAPATPDAAPGPRPAPPRRLRPPTRSPRRPAPTPTRPRRRRPTRTHPSPGGSTTPSERSATSFPPDGWSPTRPTSTTVRRCSARSSGRPARASHHRWPTTPAWCSASWTRSSTPAPKPTTPRPQRDWHRTWASSSCPIRAPGSIRRPPL